MLLRWAIHEPAHRLIWVGEVEARRTPALVNCKATSSVAVVTSSPDRRKLPSPMVREAGKAAPLIAAEVDDLVDGGPLFPRLGREDFLRDLPAAIDLQQRKLIGEEPRWNRTFELHVGHCRTDEVD